MSPKCVGRGEGEGCEGLNEGKRGMGMGEWKTGDLLKAENVSDRNGEKKFGKF